MSRNISSPGILQLKDPAIASLPSVAFILNIRKTPVARLVKIVVHTHTVTQNLEHISIRSDDYLYAVLVERRTKICLWIYDNTPRAISLLTSLHCEENSMKTYLSSIVIILFESHLIKRSKIRWITWLPLHWRNYEYAHVSIQYRQKHIVDCKYYISARNIIFKAIIIIMLLKKGYQSEIADRYNNNNTAW